jgi:hypothetical protein
MKKLLAVLVVLSLATAGAFAQVNVNWGGLVWSSGNLLAGDNHEDSDIHAGGLYGEVRLWASGNIQSNVGTFSVFAQAAGLLGAPRVAIRPDTPGSTPHVWNGVSNGMRMWGNATWWGLDNRLFVGLGSWLFALNDLNRQAFMMLGTPMSTRDIQHRQPAITWFDPFMLELVDHGLAVDIVPVPHVRIGFGVANAWNWTELTHGGAGPAVGANPRTAEEVYANIVTRLRVDLDGIGRLGLGYSGRNNHSNRVVAGQGRSNVRRDVDMGDIYAFFHLNAIDNMGVDFGLRFGMVEDAQDLSIGVGVNYTFGDYGVRFRGTFALPVGEFWDNRNDATRIAAEVFPWIILNPNMMFGTNLGVGMNIAGSDNDADAQMIFFANPYFTIHAGGGGAQRIQFGFRISGHNNRGVDRDGATTMQWEVPIAFQFSF